MIDDTFSIGEHTVSRLGFGAMRITGEGIWGWPDDRDGARALLRRVAELGIHLIDTADAYGPETSEYLLAEALHPYPNLLVATRGGLERSGPGDWSTNGRPAHLRIACHNSLRRLQVDTIELYQLHAVDDDVPLEDSVGELVRLQEEGKIRHVGLCNVSVDQLDRARELVDVVTVQNRYNLGDRAHEAVLDRCEELGIGFIPWYPLAAGDLTKTDAFQEIAERHDATPAQLALAWLLHRSPVMLPIPGTSSIAHLEQNTKARELSLTDDEVETLAELAKG